MSYSHCLVRYNIILTVLMIYTSPKVILDVQKLESLVATIYYLIFEK